jgi:NAD(P)H dehydrogenase (quinone)
LSRCYVEAIATEEAVVHHLVIAAHPNVVETYMAALAERKYRVECCDLYAAHFNPVMSARDLAAIGGGKLAKDVRTEQAAINRADVVTFTAPLWWSGLPAMLKGYPDRVFCAASPT